MTLVEALELAEGDELEAAYLIGGDDPHWVHHHLIQLRRLLNKPTDVPYSEVVLWMASRS